jgi:hypothetical protein
VSQSPLQINHYQVTTLTGEAGTRWITTNVAVSYGGLQQLLYITQNSDLSDITLLSTIIIPLAENKNHGGLIKVNKRECT